MKTYSKREREQRQLLTEITNGILKQLLKNSGQWPEEWNGVDLRWLLMEAVRYEVRGFTDSRRSRRYRSFSNTWITKNLY